jgi:tetratricopeptide (TPR) repeat protein
VWLQGALLCASVFVTSPAVASAVVSEEHLLTAVETPSLTQATAVTSDNAFAEELARVDATIESIQRLVVANERSWLPLEKLASAHLNRARLTGDVNDYRAAIDAIDRAFLRSGDKSGPFVTRASINVAVHRFDQAINDLEIASKALLIDKDTVQVIDSLYADALLQTDRIFEARTLYEQLDASTPSMTSAVRLAHWHSGQGEHQTAKQWLDIADERFLGTSAYALGWLQLQHGVVHLEQQQLNEARRYFEMANDTFPGYWLIEEHIAEVDTLQGRLEQAESRYRDIVARTRLPQMMIALADVLETRDSDGNQTEIASLRDQSQSLIDAINEDLPELLAGH